MNILKQKWPAIVCAIVILTGVISFLNFKRDNAVKPVMAGVGNNVSGFAWSSSIGWISFNSTDCDTDGDGFYEGSGEEGGVPPAGCPTSGTAQNYGVTLNKSTGNISGYAWSQSVGWISFNRCGTDDNCMTSDGDTGNPPFAPYNTGSGAIARYNSANGEITGWAKILSMGDSGWIKLRKNSGDSGSVYGVSLNSDDFSGWAWNDDENGSGIGWISFNCANTGGCGSSAYKVAIRNTPPVLSDLTAPNWSYQQAADYGGALRAFLKWEFDDLELDDQGAYHVIFDDNADFSSPLKDTGRIDTASQSALIDSSTGVALDYDTEYFWKVRIWDVGNATSTWANHSFTTYKHEMPVPEFTLFPAKASKGEEIGLTDNNSNVYLSGAPSTAIPCDFSNCSWFWEVPSASYMSSDTASSSIIRFDTEGVYDVTLTITDADGYAVSTTTTITIGSALPKWREVK